MFHSVTLGHLDIGAIEKYRWTVVLKPLDMDLVRRLLLECGAIEKDGVFRFGHSPVQLGDGYLVCAWLLPGRPQEMIEQFARLLVQETGCIVAEVRGRRLVEFDGYGNKRYRSTASAETESQRLLEPGSEGK